MSDKKRNINDVANFHSNFMGYKKYKKIEYTDVPIIVKDRIYYTSSHAINESSVQWLKDSVKDSTIDFSNTIIAKVDPNAVEIFLNIVLHGDDKSAITVDNYDDVIKIAHYLKCQSLNDRFIELSLIDKSEDRFDFHVKYLFPLLNSDTTSFNKILNELEYLTCAKLGDYYKNNNYSEINKEHLGLIIDKQQQLIFQLLSNQHIKQVSKPGFGSSIESGFGTSFGSSSGGFESGEFGVSTGGFRSSTGDFGSGGFGSSTGSSNGSSNGSAFGSSNGSAFGSSNGSAFGASNGSAFGSSNGSAFGASNGSAFGSSSGSAFGSSSGSAFGASTGSAFGSSTSSLPQDSVNKCKSDFRDPDYVWY